MLREAGLPWSTALAERLGLGIGRRRPRPDADAGRFESTMVDPMAQHKNPAAEILGLPMNLAANG
jgi:hypothetical protein